MPNIKSAKKRVKTSLKAKQKNNAYQSSMKTAIKKIDKLGSETKLEEAKRALADAFKKIDKAFAKKLIHKNKVARTKSKLTKKVNKMK